MDESRVGTSTVSMARSPWLGLLGGYWMSWRLAYDSPPIDNRRPTTTNQQPTQKRTQERQPHKIAIWTNNTTQLRGSETILLYNYNMVGTKRTFLFTTTCTMPKVSKWRFKNQETPFLFSIFRQQGWYQVVQSMLLLIVGCRSCVRFWISARKLVRSPCQVRFWISKFRFLSSRPDEKLIFE